MGHRNDSKRAMYHLSHNAMHYSLLLLSQYHRVLAPKDEHARNRHRMSLGVFIHPNADTVVSSVNHGSAGKSILARDHMEKIMKETVQ